MDSMSKAAGLEFEDRGDGDAVLLIHGGVVADAFLPLSRQPSLASRFRVIWYHHRGYGGSDGLAGPCSIADQARDALALLQELGVERAHIVGHSGGGAIGIRLALDAPSIVHSLVLLESAVFTRDEATGVDFIGPLTEIYRSGEPGKAIHLFMKGAGGPNWRADIEVNIPNAAAQAEKDAAGLFEGDLPEVWASWFRCLSDPSRVLLLNRLATAGRSLTVGELVELVDIGQPTVSHHLKVLSETGFVHRVREANTSLYSVNERCLERFPSAAELIMGVLPRYKQQSPDCLAPWQDQPDRKRRSRRKASTHA